MDTYKQKFTRLQNGILRLLCIRAGKALNQRGIAKILKVSPTAVAKAAKDLEKEGLIKVTRSRTMNLTLMELDRDSQNAVHYKRVENLKMAYESGLADFLEEKFPGCAIILFGSYSTGEDTEKSDMDIAIVGSKGKELDMASFEDALERKIVVQYYEDFGKIDANLRSNILSGITLKGAVEL